MNRRWGLPLVLVAAAAASADAPAPRRIVRSPQFDARVKAAVDRGVAWLRGVVAADAWLPRFPTMNGVPDGGTIAPNDHFAGAEGALAYVALRSGGVAADDPAAKAAWLETWRQYDPTKFSVYSASIDLVAFAAHGDPVPASADGRDVKLSDRDAKSAAAAVQWLVELQNDDGGWSDVSGGLANPRDARAVADPFPVRAGRSDNRCTQYAVLGLDSAARSGIPFDPSTWKRALAHWIDDQDATGPDVRQRMTGAPNRPAALPVDHARGWSPLAAVRPVDRRWRTPTAGAVASILACRRHLAGSKAMTPGLDAASRKAAWDGLAWLGVNWNRVDTRSPAPANFDVLQFLADVALDSGADALWTVQRAADAAGVEWFGENDWFAAGAAVLLPTQLSNGSWSGTGSTNAHAADCFAATCFALLFLSRGLPFDGRGALSPSDGDADVDFARFARADDAPFAAALDLALGRLRRSTDVRVLADLLDRAVEMGPRIVEPLIVRMDSSEPDVRAAAHELLRRATGLDFGYAAHAPADQRETAVQKWQAWWLGAKDKLVYDPAKKLLVAQ